MTVVAAPPTLDRERSLQPTPHDLVDLGFGVVLAVLGVIGFRSTFGGSEEITVGVPAVILGAAVGYVLAKLRVQLLVGAAIGVALFFLFGGVAALRDDATAGVLPNLDVFDGLVDGTINGWARLLTTQPPAGQAGNLLAVPYLSGYAGGLLAVVAAIALPRWPACVLPPAMVLGVSVLLGVEDPASLLLQGAVFGVLTVGWLSLRTRRIDPALVAGGRRRIVTGAAMLVVVAVGAFGVGPSLPGAGANERFLLRDRYEPPFDPSQYPSALTRFRDYHGEEPIEDTLFTVDGLPQGAVIRFAVMDDYDGYVWRASPPGSAVGGDYLRVGEEIARPQEGEPVRLDFEMGALADVDSVWIPTVGSPSSITFDGERSDVLTDEFRFNRETETAASPNALRRGDTWTVEAMLPEPVDPGRFADLPVDPSITLPTLPGASEEIIGRFAQVLRDQGLEAASPYERISAIRDALRGEGGYTDGTPPHTSPAGHGIARLEPFFTGPQPVGNGEQFAAGLAFAARSLGIPARVVLEFHPDASGGPVEVVADDAVAMVEIALADVGWVQLEDPTPDEDVPPIQQVQVDREVAADQVQPPPPTTIPPRTPLPEEQQRAEDDDDVDEASGGADGILGLVLQVLTIAAVPFVVLVVPALVVLVLKARRRQRRRTTGSPGARIAAGWTEVIDLARDAGASVPMRATRREVSRFLAPESARALAAQADALTFGDADPTDEDVDAVWRSVFAVRADLLSPMPRFDRLRAAVSLTSLRGA